MFLGSGSVIHGMHEEQDLFKMGGLRKQMPITAYTFLIGALAISGVTGLAGFWSKDEIIVGAWHGGYQVIAVLGLITAALQLSTCSGSTFSPLKARGGMTTNMCIRMSHLAR